MTVPEGKFLFFLLLVIYQNLLQSIVKLENWNQQVACLEISELLASTFLSGISDVRSWRVEMVLLPLPRMTH